MAGDWISTAEAAELSGFSAQRIRRLIQKGKISASRKGTMFWIDRASLLAHLSGIGRSVSASTAKGVLPPQPDTARPPQPVPKAPVVSDSSGRDEAANKSEPNPPPGNLSLAAIEWLDTAGRVLYDILRDYQTRHPDKGTKSKLSHAAADASPDNEPSERRKPTEVKKRRRTAQSRS
jgi:excisionase family DNA binding protein